MKKLVISESKKDLNALCTSVRKLTMTDEYGECYRLITDAMKKYPHAAAPHNLMGVILEKEGDHMTAMKHFRAAWALDPTYLPARQNLETFGTFFSYGKSAFNESDCTEEKPEEYVTEQEANSIGHMVRKE